MAPAASRRLRWPRRFGVDVLYTAFRRPCPSRSTTLRSRPTPRSASSTSGTSRARSSRRRPPRSSAGPGPRGPHRRPGGDQRGQRHHHGAVQRLTGSGARRSRPGGSLGLGQPAGVRPSPAARVQSPSTPPPRTRSPTIPGTVAEALRSATTPHRGSGPSSTSRSTRLFTAGGLAGARDGRPSPRPAPAEDDLAGLAQSASPRRRGRSSCSAATSGPTRPTDVARHFAEELQIPVIMNGMGRGTAAGGLRSSTPPASGARRSGAADLVVVAGTPLDFRLGFGVFGGKDGRPPARVVHLADAPDRVAAPRRPGSARPRRARRGARAASLDRPSDATGHGSLERAPARSRRCRPRQRIDDEVAERGQRRHPPGPASTARCARCSTRTRS